MKKIVLLLDWKLTDKKFWLGEEFENLGFDVKIIGLSGKRRIIPTRGKTLIKWFQFFIVALKSIRYSFGNAIILCWNFNIGAICGALYKVLRRKNSILSLNLIIWEESLNNLFFGIRRMIFQLAFNNRYFFSTINSPELVEYYKLFNIENSRFYNLPDPYYPWNEKDFYTEGKGYIFSGGRSTRDWETFLDAAHSLPNVNFIIVANKKIFNHKLRISNNVKIYFDINDKLFYDLLKKSSIVVIPLTSNAPAGLTVLIRSALLSKPVIATETVCVKNYITNGKNGVLVKMSDSASLANEIEKLVESNDLMKLYGTELRRFVEEEHSPQKYVKQLSLILDDVNKVN
jgi:glycosyltransferase involved in cell wall biosynthesis